uniref:Vav 3 guanine nucleotide exchange factor b n=1 Tax=Cyprinus carpio TaxID=7962 RepID=A0A8C1PZD8_CYPCA
MEYWRQCSLWLIDCKVLPRNHRVTADSAQVFDLAQTLRDGVLLCQLLNNLRPDTINLKEINIRPQMSQFLCLKNIRTFLSACCEAFGMKKSELFEAFDLFDVRDFGKVMKKKIKNLLLVKQAEVDIRSCCLLEIKQTEAKYSETLETIEKVRFAFSGWRILSYQLKGNFLLRFCRAFCFPDSVYFVLQECSKRANNGKFTLRDLLVVPMQRVLKYPLLLQELVKYTSDNKENSNLRLALDAMRDLAQYVNEVKRDVETLREIDQYQRSIENLNQCLLSYGRPKGDGEVRLVSNVDKRRQDRHIFLFDVAVIVCKRRGDNYEMKEVINLNHFKITDNPITDKDCRKWCYGFYLTHQQGQSGFEFLFKTKDLKKKWLDQFEMAISNIRPENATFNSHHFRMHTFERATSCSSCHMLLRGIFNQGYLCSKCGNGAHKGCLGKLGVCGRAVLILPHFVFTGLPKMLVIRDYFGVPSPLGGPPLNAKIGDVIEIICADPHSSWWQGKILTTQETGFFPSDAVKPCPCVSMYICMTCVIILILFAGPMERHHAESELMERDNSTYLVRYRSRESKEYAISIKYNNDVKHIKILTREGCFYIAESRTFKTVLGLVEYYKQHSLKEGFRTLDTTLQVPYKELGSGFRPAGEYHTPFLDSLLVLTPRVLGIALARYDFGSRDTRELSLRVGDLVKIYTKSTNGWWKGEVNGRVRKNNFLHLYSCEAL